MEGKTDSKVSGEQPVQGAETSVDAADRVRHFHLAIDGHDNL